MILKLAFFILLSPSAFAETLSTFSDVSVNYLDWDSGTERKSPKEDFVYLEIEGGGQYSWGDLYGFFDLENPAKPGADVRSAGKANINYYIAQSKFTVYGHVYNFSALGFSEQNRVLGLGYAAGGDGWWFKPFIGVHDVTQTFFSGTNGFMAGWVVGKYVTVAGVKLLLADWHEMEFDRAPAYAAVYGDKRTSLNGAASIWWNGPGGLSLGAQYRYATDKLGTRGAMSAGIYTVKWFF